MGIVNWRREGLFLAIAGMETCWVVGWSRLLLNRTSSTVTGLSWWSVLGLYLLALIIARTVGRVEARRGPWVIGALAFLTSLLLLWLNLGALFSAPRRPADPSTAVQVLSLFLGLLVWYRALRIPDQVGDTRSIARHFQLGLLIMVGTVLASRWPQAPMTDLVIGYFGCGLMAVALTRIEEVARTEPSGAAPFDLKWALILATTLLVAGLMTLAATQVITVETVRWLLRPVTILLSLALYVFAWLVTELIVQLLPLLRWLLDDITLEQLRESAENLRPPPLPAPEEEVAETPLLSAQFQEALVTGLVVVLILIALWLVARSFRRWQMRAYATPGGVRESVDSEGSLAEDLAEYLRDQWRRLREADLRRLFRRLGTASVRAIYANLLALMAAADHPRQPEQTPYEYEPGVEALLPARQTEISTLTEAFVRARYGEVEVDAQELARLQEAWERIRVDGQELLP
jgi:hypothetical protein